MFRTGLGIALAFTGVIVGAGFASGQEAVQFFVAFGTWGLAGALLASVLMIVSGIAILQFGSYFQAQEHTAVLSRISGKTMSWLLDIATVVTLFAIGFVMFAGGGSNLEQQFGWPVWVGALLMLVLVLVTGMLDVDKVSKIIGAVTPFVIVFIVFVTVWTLFTADYDVAGLNVAAQEVQTTLPNWWIAALNYVGLCVMTAVSMAAVIGGNFLDTKAAGVGGLIGGLFFLVMLLLLVAALFLEVETVGGAELPVLALIDDIHPILGLLMSVVIFAMIYNTAIGMFYALGKRLTRNRREWYRPVFIVACLIGFGLSFVGFSDLVSYVYPALGYLGIVMIAVLAVAWLRGGSKLRAEGRRRVRAKDLTRRRMDPRLRFTKRQQRELGKIIAASNIPDEEFTEQLEDEIHEELESDRGLDYDREDPASDVVYVDHSDPQTRAEYDAGQGGADRPQG